MAATEKKRKRASLLSIEGGLPHPLNLDTPNDGGRDQPDSEGDDEVDPFPGLDIESDSEDEDGDQDEDEDEDEDDEEDVDEGDDDELGEEDVTEQQEDGRASSDEDEIFSIFPKPKIVISGITGQPKFMYPPIEPEYDTDSSTEDVRILL